MTEGLEKERKRIQDALDEKKSRPERNRMGQFSTPYRLAEAITREAKRLMPSGDVRFLEPSAGMGVFYSAFLTIFGTEASVATGYEIDPHYGGPSQMFWKSRRFDIRIGDFFRAEPERKYNLLISNPPYSRHHHIPSDEKAILGGRVKEETGLTLSGLAGLYCYFLILSGKWLEEGALSVWLIPSEFMDVNYGKSLKQYLLEHVELVRIHRFLPEEVKFDDALVTSSVVFFRNRNPREGHVARLTEGGSLDAPLHDRTLKTSGIRPEDKWSRLFSRNDEETGTETGKEVRLGDFFTVSRGLATGDNKFFIIGRETVKHYQIPAAFLKPILPAPRYMKADIIRRESQSMEPDALYLFSCAIPEEDLRRLYPSVWEYVRHGMEQGVADRYICRNRPLWYSCENRAPAPLLIPYMGRKNSGTGAFRFILNETDIIATNSYLMIYPKQSYRKHMEDKLVIRHIWNVLNRIPKTDILSEGRVYGGGLYKVEPRELMNLPVPALTEIIGTPKHPIQLDLF